MNTLILHIGRAVHESWLSSLESSPESHVQSRVESRVIAFSRGWVESRVISLESKSSQVIAKVSRVIIVQLVVSSKLLTSKVKGISNNPEWSLYMML